MSESTNSPAPSMLFPYLNRNEAAAYLTISVRHLTNLVASRRIKAARLGRRLVFLRSELDRFMELQLALA